MANKHCFALYVPSLSALNQEQDKIFFYKDELLWHRVIHVLRLGQGDEIELFDGVSLFRIELLSGKEGKKNRVHGRIIQESAVVRQEPEISLCIGLTKKDAFYDIVYAAGQYGVTRVIPLITRRIHKNWWSNKEQRRCQEYLKAGAEQAKIYWFGHVEDPVQLDARVDCMADNATAFLCDAQASLNLIEACKKTTGQSFRLFIGPEGGFESSEVQILQEYSAQSVTLSQAILRSQDATLLSLGIMRMVL